MSGRGWKKAFAWSAAAHGVLLAVLLWRVAPVAPVAPATEPSEEIALEISSFEIEKADSVALPHNAQQSPPTPTQKDARTRLSQRDANTDLHPEAEPEPSLPSMESDEAHGVQGKGGVDRLGSFQGTAALPGIHMNAPAESAAPLLGPAPSVTNMNSPKPLDQHVVVGRGGVTMHLAEDGSIAGFADPSSGIRGGLAQYPAIGDTGGSIAPSIIGKFDLTNQLMRAVGQNPYRYEQHRLAEETREERICRMKAAQEQNEREALFRLSGQLATIWNETSPVDLKRNLLFSLWDECREESTDAGAVSALAYQATIESFIRKHLPTGSALAFTNTELASLNQRRTSSRKFDPYATLRGSAVRPDAGSTAL